ncbi:MAG: Hsp20/alpha crystallin family protein [Labilithrix sp.]|nr:Hsp20/alpha crystallin family protein [Labilithrix sp.]
MATQWDPFAEIAWRTTNEEDAARPWFVPAIDIFEDDESFLVKVELPGVRPDDVVVDVQGGILSIRGERELENAQHREGYRRIERAYGVFSRSFALPDNVDGTDAVAVISEGVMTLRLPKCAPASVEPPTVPPIKRAS